MRYGSICSGIEAATVAWHPLGWTPVFFSEIEAAPRAVLAHHWPEVPIHGDFTTIEDGQFEPIDLLVGGTPCQDFSIAGLRAGLAGDRGNLTLEFVRLVDRLRPLWVVWENVPGVLSIDSGRAFGAFLGGLAELGYGFAYRVLDAQHFGVPQRRRRVFVVGYLGDWRRAAAVLFERESLSGNPPPRREARQGIARPITPGSPGGSGYRNDCDTAENLVASSAVRRLTPMECERLQGFPDGYTAVLHRGKPMADGPRYKMLGNSMAVPCMAWIGERIEMVNGVVAERIAA
jgi:DNA (cytosine-5)-methyltransferase 1